MSDWQHELCPRWEAVRAKGRSLGWHENDSPYVMSLADLCGLKWYDTRSQDRVADFMGYDAESFFNKLDGFGRIKCQRLIEILEAASADVDAPQIHEDSARACTQTGVEVLHLWGVPEEYPLHLLPLSARLANFCENQKITTLPTLLEVWATIGDAGLMTHENIGRRTADELRSFANSIVYADAIAARRWLPLNDGNNGLCLRPALALCYGMLTAQAENVLRRRLVDKLTLEESAGDCGITRERARQYEAAYLADLRAILNWFSRERAEMLDAWLEHREWAGPALPQDTSEVAELILAGIEACFTDTAQGVARRLAAESLNEGRFHQLWNHSDLFVGGVDLQAFMDENVPVKDQAEFVTEVSNQRGLFVDHAEGLVKPVTTNASKSIRAILDQEEEPIPLTWLVHRLQAISGYSEIDADYVRRNRYRWSMAGALDLSKVLWNE